MDPKDKIAILLEEYKAIRAEILQRTVMLNRIYAVAGTIGAGLIGAMIQTGLIVAGVATLTVLIAIVAFGIWLNDHTIRVLALRVRIIESEVNRLAKDKLLAWETDHGLQALKSPSRVFDFVEFGNNQATVWRRRILEFIEFAKRHIRKKL